MANTNKLKNIVEPYVRSWLTDKYHKPFEEKEFPLELITGGQHRFDIVSEDRTIVGGIKANSLRGNGGIGVGPINSATTELYYLNLAKAEKKLLVLTNKGFYEFFKRRMLGKVMKDTEIVYCALPEKLQHEVAEVHKSASAEIGKTLPR